MDKEIIIKPNVGDIYMHPGDNEKLVVRFVSDYSIRFIGGYICSYRTLATMIPLKNANQLKLF